MNYYPTTRAKSRPRMQAPKPGAPVRCEPHLAWVRKLYCVCSEIDPDGCGGKVRACHLRIGTNGGTGMKPGDNWTWPGCDNHHGEQHDIGELSFQKKYRLNLKAICEKTWRLSPHRIAWERKQQDCTPTPTPDGSTGAAEDVSPSVNGRMSASTNEV